MVAWWLPMVASFASSSMQSTGTPQAGPVASAGPAAGGGNSFMGSGGAPFDFGVSSLRYGGTAKARPDEQYAAFKPGGAFGPPSLAQFSAAAKGRDTFGTVLQGLAPGLGKIISDVISGPGRGEQRRASARSFVESSPGLASLRRRVVASVPRGSSMSAELRSVLQGATTTERSALTQVLQEAAGLGGLGSAYGERANYLQDVIKYALTGETAAPKRYLPSLAELAPFAGVTGETTAGAGAGVARGILPGYAGPGQSYWTSFGTRYRV